MPAASRRCLIRSAIASLPARSTVTKSSMCTSGAERGGELVERRLLGGADLRPVLFVALGDASREGQDELPVLLDLLRGRVALERRHGLLEELHAMALELVVGMELGVVALRLGGDDRVEQLTVAVLLARLAVRLGHRERLAHHPAVVGHRHDHARHGWPRQDLIPFRLGEIGFSGHGFDDTCLRPCRHHANRVNAGYRDGGCPPGGGPPKWPRSVGPEEEAKDAWSAA